MNCPGCLGVPRWRPPGGSPGPMCTRAGWWGGRRRLPAVVGRCSRGFPRCRSAVVETVPGDRESWDGFEVFGGSSGAVTTRPGPVEPDPTPRDADLVPWVTPPAGREQESRAGLRPAPVFWSPDREGLAYLTLTDPIDSYGFHAGVRAVGLSSRLPRLGPVGRPRHVYAISMEPGAAISLRQTLPEGLRPDLVDAQDVAAANGTANVDLLLRRAVMDRARIAAVFQPGSSQDEVPGHELLGRLLSELHRPRYQFRTGPVPGTAAEMAAATLPELLGRIAPTAVPVLPEAASVRYSDRPDGRGCRCCMSGAPIRGCRLCTVCGHPMWTVMTCSRPYIPRWWAARLAPVSWVGMRSCWSKAYRPTISCTPRFSAAVWTDRRLGTNSIVPRCSLTRARVRRHGYTPGPSTASCSRGHIRSPRWTGTPGGSNLVRGRKTGAFAAEALLGGAVDAAAAIRERWSAAGYEVVVAAAPVQAYLPMPSEASQEQRDQVIAQLLRASPATGLPSSGWLVRSTRTRVAPSSVRCSRVIRCIRRPWRGGPSARPLWTHRCGCGRADQAGARPRRARCARDTGEPFNDPGRPADHPPDAAVRAAEVVAASRLSAGLSADGLSVAVNDQPEFWADLDRLLVELGEVGIGLGAMWVRVRTGFGTDIRPYLHLIDLVHSQSRALAALGIAVDAWAADPQRFWAPATALQAVLASPSNAGLALSVEWRESDSVARCRCTAPVRTWVGFVPGSLSRGRW